VSGAKGSKSSWLTPVIKDYPQSRMEQPPYLIGASYSQWRKVSLFLSILFFHYRVADKSLQINLSLRLVKQSKIAYSLIIRARPDHVFVQV